MCLHLQRIEHAACEKVVVRLAGHLLDDGAEQFVAGVAVTERVAGSIPVSAIGQPSSA